jgi:DNA-binding transcriptional ArsR family regulator
VRLQIISALADGERSCAELIESTGQSKVNLSRHVSLLASRGVVRRRRQGKRLFVAIANPNILQAYLLMSGALREILAAEMTTVTECSEDASPSPFAAEASTEG